jgi:uncharacterized membrane protein YbhN (UPF0104 family)
MANRVTRERLLRFVPALRVIAAGGAIALVVVIAVRAGRHVDLGRLTWWPLALALGAAVCWWLLLARGWALLVSGQANCHDVSQWCRTQALRYLPGAVWAPVSRATIVDGSLLQRVATVGAENVVALSCALSVGGAALAAGGRPIYLVAVPVAGAPLVVVRVAGVRAGVSPDRVRAAVANGLAAFLFYALAAVAVQASVSGASHVFEVAGAAAIAWAVGLVVIVAPSGLGIREVVYVALLGSALPSSELALGAVAMRLAMIVAELGVLLLVGMREIRATVPRGR